MIKTASFPEAHARRYFLADYPAVYLDTYITNLIADFRNAADPVHLDGGQALFAEYGERVALTHAHPVDQWQLYVAGVARLAKKPVAPVVVQYTDAWVPYGPIEVSKAGFALLAFWPRPNDATYEMPQDADTIRAHLRGQPHRILLKRLEATAEVGAAPAETTLIKEGAIWARHWRLPAGATLETPDPSQGGGKVGGEGQAAGLDVRRHQRIQARFVDRHHILMQQFDLAGVLVDANDFMPEV